jgi:enoyl-CoA hydratase/carnithine racemase
MADEGTVRIEVAHGVGWIVLDRPPLNVINASMTRAIRAGVERLDADEACGIIVLTAAGDRAFAAGADVGEHRLELVRELNDELFATAHVLMRADGKPRIAAVKGICSGGANEVAFACDFVVARSDTRFALPEIRIGAVGGFGAFLMAQAMAPGKVLELALNGEWLSAEEARSFGLVTTVLPREGFDAALRAYLGRFTDKSWAALRLGRRHFRQLRQMSVADGMQALPGYLMDEAVRLEDYEEGVNAFLARRQPVWRHR